MKLSASKFVTARQSPRGSSGEFEFLGRREQYDVYDVAEWIGRQPWCNGKVGGIGQSYFCMLQWFSLAHKGDTTARRNPSIRCGSSGCAAAPTM
jgi:predicted acyl esterase